jgi:hypothetical protein
MSCVGHAAMSSTSDDLGAALRRPAAGAARKVVVDPAR